MCLMIYVKILGLVKTGMAQLMLSDGSVVTIKRLGHCVDSPPSARLWRPEDL